MTVPTTTGTTAAGNVRGRAPITHALSPDGGRADSGVPDGDGGDVGDGEVSGLATTNNRNPPTVGFRMQQIHRGLVVVAMVTLGAVFATAAAAKANNRAAAETSARDLGVPSQWAPSVARLLPFFEGTIPVVLAIGLFYRAAAVIGAVFAMVLLLAFTTAIIRTLRAGQTPVCQCFGSLRSRPIGPDTIVRNLALLLLAVVTAVG